MSAEPPEQLLDAFKATALSVTKLYKTSVAAQAKARADGYQDCLEDLMAFLNRENIGLSDSSETSKIRRWAAERQDGRDSMPPSVESEDETDKGEAPPSPEPAQRSTAHPDPLMPIPSSPPPPLSHNHSRDHGHHQHTNHHAALTTAPHAPEFTMPTTDSFTFRPPPHHGHESYLNLERLDLSDSRSHENAHTPTSNASARSSRRRQSASGSGGRNGARSNNSSSGHPLGRGAGQKRKINYAEIFDLGSLSAKEVFGCNKRNRQV